MVKPFHTIFQIADRSYFAIIKKDIHALALEAGFSETRIAEIDIIVAELVSNLVKHAGGGQVLVRLYEEAQSPAIEIISVDNGAGMSDVNRMLSDGVSTKNTLGHGLGSINRLADFCQIYSQKDWGTIVLARVLEKRTPRYRKPAAYEIKSVLLPKPGEQVCGDGFFSKVNDSHIQLFLGDGLGHGPDAAAAVASAGRAFEAATETDPVLLIREINTQVKKTRGLVGTVAVFNIRDRVWRVCGVGNIITRVQTGLAVRNYMSYNGIIGLNLPNTLNSQSISYEKGQTILMSSDGLKSRWEIAKHPGITRFDLSIVAAALIKDFARNTDDMSAVACRINL